MPTKSLMNNWFESLKTPSYAYCLDDDFVLKVPGRVERHLGPRAERAAIEFEVRHFNNGPIWSTELNFPREELDYAEWAVFGFLDAVLTQSLAPIRDVQIIVKSMDVHPIDSSQVAFRRAGNEAGMDFLEKLGLMNRKKSAT